MKIPVRFLDRARPALKKYLAVLGAAKTRDVNESDTCVIVSDMLADILGWEKYGEITTEFAIRSTFCDLAVKWEGHVAFLIEVKSIGTDLRDNHLRQAIDYAANSGVEWVLLTNGVQWHAHRVRFEQPIASDEVFVIDLLSPDAKPSTILEQLYLISREGASRSDLQKYWQHKEATSRYVIAQLVLSPAGIAFIRRALRQTFKGLKVREEHIESLLRHEVLKREVLEGDRASHAGRLVKRRARRRAKELETPPTDSTPQPPSP